MWFIRFMTSAKASGEAQLYLMFLKYLKTFYTHFYYSNISHSGIVTFLTQVDVNIRFKRYLCDKISEIEYNLRTEIKSKLEETADFLKKED